MREIKFRAWGIHSEEFLQGEEGDRGFTLEQISNIHLIENWDFTQYTGLKDKNLVEIYEDDVVTCQGNMYKVFFMDGIFYARCSEMNMQLPLSSLPITEVIGNIYKNPNLLTK